MLDRRVIEKYIEFFTTKIKIMYKEKTFKFKDTRLKYILETSNESNDLMIIFSGLPRKGLTARYNYMRSTNDFNINRLFILDDFGYDERGNYYLGKNKKMCTADAVINLITKIKKELNHNNGDTVYYVGSSKGGYAALYFGIRDSDEPYIISGAPQYNLGLYLTNDEARANNQMKFICGDDYTEKDVAFLNDLLKNSLYAYRENKNKIYLHYSKNEPIYKVHMIDMLEDLKVNNYDVFEDVGEYGKHADLSFHFPEYIRKTFVEIKSQI